MPWIVLTALFVTLAGMPVASSAQWLNPHLDNQRWSNLRKHQQKLRQQNGTKKAETTKAETGKTGSGKAGPGKAAAPVKEASAKAQPLTPAERQAAWSRNKAEYRQRLLRDGQDSADRWLDRAALSSRK